MQSKFNREGPSLLSVGSMLRTFLDYSDVGEMGWLTLILMIVKYFNFFNYNNKVFLTLWTYFLMQTAHIS